MFLEKKNEISVGHCFLVCVVHSMINFERKGTIQQRS